MPRSKDNVSLLPDLKLLFWKINTLNVIYAIRILGQDFDQSDANVFERLILGIWRLLL